MCNIENIELIKKYICNEITNFKPVITKGDYLQQLNVFINNLINDDLQSIFCLYQRAVDMKRKINEYERTIKELKNKIPDIMI